MSDIALTPEQQAPVSSAPAGVDADRRATDQARRMTGENSFQQMFAMNPLGAFFMLILGLSELFGKDGNNLLGDRLTNFLGSTFNVDNPRALIKGLEAPARIGTIETGERQDLVKANLPAAAQAAGISPDLLAGVWGIESRFGTHQTLVSSTGCAGDFQFTRGTFDDMIDKHGEKIAALAGDQITPEIADALRAGNWKIETEWGSDLRFHPTVSTYASAFYLNEVASGLGVDPKNQENFGVIFAGYNVGPGNADKLLDLHQAGSERAAQAVLGSAALHNPLFYKGGASATEALSRYQSYVETRVADYHQNFSSPAADTHLAAASGTSTSQRTGTSYAAQMEGRNGQISPDFADAVAGRTPEGQPTPAIQPGATPDDPHVAQQNALG